MILLICLLQFLSGASLLQFLSGASLIFPSTILLLLLLLIVRHPLLHKSLMNRCGLTPEGTDQGIRTYDRS